MDGSVHTFCVLRQPKYYWRAFSRPPILTVPVGEHYQHGRTPPRGVGTRRFVSAAAMPRSDRPCCFRSRRMGRQLNSAELCFRLKPYRALWSLIGTRLGSASMLRMLLGANGCPCSLRYPTAASSPDISRNERCPPLGRLRRSCRASATISGLSSAWLLRPSTYSRAVLLPVEWLNGLVRRRRRIPERCLQGVILSQLPVRAAWPLSPQKQKFRDIDASCHERQ
jgi:hypothetical protein